MVGLLVVWLVGGLVGWWCDRERYEVRVRFSFEIRNESKSNRILAYTIEKSRERAGGKVVKTLFRMWLYFS